jgi:tRNA (guanine10-N2)-methyltransferase
MRVLVAFVATRREFRLAELDSIMQLHGLDPCAAYDHASADLSSPFMVLRLPSERDAARLAHRCILIRGVYELWGHGSTYAEAVRAVAEAPEEAKAAHFSADRTWCVRCDTFGRAYTMEQQETMRAQFKSVAPFAGRVRLRGADEQFWILEDHIVKDNFSDCSDSAGAPVGEAAPGPPPTGDAAPPRSVFFAREIAAQGAPLLPAGGGGGGGGSGGDDGRHRAKACRKGGAQAPARSLVHALSLKQRHFLGPTAMDNELSLLMANLAQVPSCCSTTAPTTAPTTLTAGHPRSSRGFDLFLARWHQL